MGAEQWLLDVRDLRTYFHTDDGTVKAVDGVSFSINPGQTVGLVGESGCGKTVTSQSILKIVPQPGRIESGAIWFRRPDGSVVDIASLDPWGRTIRSIRGKEIGFIFQEPMVSLSPVHSVGSQLCEVLRIHDRTMSKEAARSRAESLLTQVGLPNAAALLDSYIHQLSGGMRQRVMVALALSCGPRLLIADEPTTAVDVTIQAKNLALLTELIQQQRMALLLVTHDLGVIAEVADEVVVMYLGRVVERSPVKKLFHEPLHPYTQALLQSIPRADVKTAGDLSVIRGSVPDPYTRPPGCHFAPRCEEFIPGQCDAAEPALIAVNPEQEVRCILHAEERATV